MVKHSKYPGEITALLHSVGNGDRAAMDGLTPLVYDELNRQARLYLNKERKNHTQQKTALVHEAFLRLMDQEAANWKNRAQFYEIAATIMRRILVKYAKNRNSLKRGGPKENVRLDETVIVAAKNRDFDLLALDEASLELSELDEQQALVVELRNLAGLTSKETAAAPSVSSSTIKLNWKMDKARFGAELTDGAHE